MESSEKIVSFPGQGLNEEVLVSKGENIIIKIYSYRKWIGIGVGALFAITLPFALTPSGQSKKLKDYTLAEKTFDTWVKAEEINQKVFEDLERIIKKHPELASKMSGDIYQKFVTFSRAKEVIQAASMQVAKSNVLGDYFSKFSNISLLISNQEFQEALEQSKMLHGKMLNDFTFHKTSSGELLISFNLFRIGVLENKLSLIKDELNTWKEFRSLVMVEGQIKTGYQPFISHFNQNGVSLLDYIRTRETTLSTQ